MMAHQHSVAPAAHRVPGPKTRGRWPAPTAGFTYIGLLVMVAMIGISLSVVGEVWHTMQMRDKEEQLLFVGGEFRRALARYAMNTPGGTLERYPRRLEDLLKDPRYPETHRYLRKIYPDPITGRADWGLVRAGDVITGVFSSSEQEPHKTTGFRYPEREFEGKTKYSDWVFTPKNSRVPLAVPLARQPPGAVQPRPVTATTRTGR